MFFHQKETHGKNYIICLFDVIAFPDHKAKYESMIHDKTPLKECH